MPVEIPIMSMLDYLFRATFLVAIGVVIASVIAETGIFSRLSRFSRPLCRISGLSEGSVLSIISMFVSATAGKSMLAEFNQKGKVEKKEIIPSLLIGTFSTVVGESLFRVQLPVAIILLGPFIGLTYVLLNIFSTFLQVIAGLVYSHLYIRKKTTDLDHAFERIDDAEEEIKPVTWKSVKTGAKKSYPALRRILPMTVGAITIFYILASIGLMDIIASLFDPILNVIGLPGESTAALVAQFVHFSAGYSIVHSLIMEGILSTQQALLTLILGSMVVITMIYLKYSVPLYLSLFGRYGVKISLITYAVSMTAKVVCILFVIAMF